MQEYLTIGEDIQSETVIKKSRFLCSLCYAEKADTAADILAKIRKTHYNATHNCYAMIIGQDASFQKASDDGEPQGTAGLPIMEALKNSGVTNIIAVVTRWFGGTLLGTGGLIRAYGGSVSDALKKARIIRNVPAAVYMFSVDYADYGKLQSIAGEFSADIKADFTDVVQAELVLPLKDEQRFLKRVSEAFLGADVCSRTDSIYMQK